MTQTPAKDTVVVSAPLSAGLRTRDGLMIALTLLTGATDATTFIKLGNVFTSVMTGNMVLMGLSIGRGDVSAFGHAALAVVSYIAGTIAGSRIVGKPRDDDPIWPLALTVALLVELALFVGVACGWWAGHSGPTGVLQTVLLIFSTLALGIQSSAILRLNVSGLSTTYLTGTLTTVVHSLVLRRRAQGNGRSIGVLCALVLGAALGGLLAIQVPAAAPAVPLVILVGVIVSAQTVLNR
ncbi:hypothetical protein GCM10023322_64500 [Rugosimonospora acidiphila]|uniref:DUF1275 domain-containing protein n=1 Tax=Rugosimonospora acidiphila TaxID=556531 RepID=A0ABP9SIU6_9ACTN